MNCRVNYIVFLGCVVVLMLFNKMESNGLSVTFSRNVLFAVIHSGIYNCI